MEKAIAFIGLGKMGGPMAANLVKAGFSVKGFDLSPTCRDAARGTGVQIAETIEDVIAGSDSVITMLPTGRNVVEVWSRLAEIVVSGTLLIDTSTIDVSSARQVHNLLGKKGCSTLDAPVSGGTIGAAAGTLTFMVGGSAEAFFQADQVLKPMGKRIVHCGEAGAGQATKICNNLITGISMAAVCEAFVLAEKLGVSHQALFDVASTSSGQCWALTTYCPVPGPVPESPANFGYKPGFATSLMLKDLRLAEEAALDTGALTPVGAAAAQLYGLFEKLGNGGRDFSALIHLLRESTWESQEN